MEHCLFIYLQLYIIKCSCYFFVYRDYWFSLNFGDKKGRDCMRKGNVLRERNGREGKGETVTFFFVIYIYIYIYIYQVGFGQKGEVFSMKEIHAEPPFPCDYVRNSYCKRIITLTAESKRAFFVCFLKSQTAH